jgi:hypothetical protein
LLSKIPVSGDTNRGKKRSNTSIFSDKQYFWANPWEFDRIAKVSVFTHLTEYPASEDLPSFWQTLTGARKDLIPQTFQISNTFGQILGNLIASPK